MEAGAQPIQLDGSSFGALGGPACPGRNPMCHRPIGLVMYEAVLGSNRHFSMKVGFSTGEPVYDEKGVSQRMLAFMQNFYGVYPELLRAPLFLGFSEVGGSTTIMLLESASSGISRVSPSQA